MHADFFEKVTDHPDLVIADFFSEQAMMYSRKHNIKYIINEIMPYSFVQEVCNLPTYKRSFGIGGFTITYPVLFNAFELILGFRQIHKVFRHHHRMIINSAIGLEHPTTIPTHHTLTGILSNRETKVLKVDLELKEWMDSWKREGKKKFLYVSFGTVLVLS
jgi:hypothetical protein